MKPKYLSFLMSALLLSGCQSNFGPDALSNTHIPYNQAISDTLKQQMLLNLVRLKYHAEPYYLKVGSVTASLNFAGLAGLNANLDLGPGGNFLSPSLGASYSDSPTISYQPLQGEAFYKSVYTNIPLGKIVTSIATGWGIDSIFGLCVDEVNGIGNAVQASGVTPKLAPKYKNFERMLVLLKQLQDDGTLKFGPSGKGKGGLIKFVETPGNRSAIEELMTIFGLSKSTRLVKTTDAEFLDLEKQADDNTLAIYTRSISGMLFYLSHNIQVPKEHIDKGLVTVTKTADGQVFNWSQTPGGKLMGIKSSSSYPDDAFLAVPYNDYWFYIADNDLQSKATFMLLMQLFDYQSGHTKSENPVLTIPVR